MEQPERRRSRRFPLRQPASFRVPGEDAREISATTQNVSKDGVLLLSDSAIPVGSRADLVLILESRLERSIRLTGSGRVERVEQDSGGQYAIAFSCEQPFTLMD
jgi:hypothetical protein